MATSLVGVSSSLVPVHQQQRRHPVASLLYKRPDWQSLRQGIRLFTLALVAVVVLVAALAIGSATMRHVSPASATHSAHPIASGCGGAILGCIPTGR